MRTLIILLLFLSSAVYSQQVTPFISSPLTGDDDMSLKMVRGIATWLDREIAASEAKLQSGYRR